jgi:hypothetical protein
MRSIRALGLVALVFCVQWIVLCGGPTNKSNFNPIHSNIPSLIWGSYFKPVSADADMHSQMMLIFWDFF